MLPPRPSTCWAGNHTPPSALVISSFSGCLHPGLGSGVALWSFGEFAALVPGTRRAGTTKLGRHYVPKPGAQ